MSAIFRSKIFISVSIGILIVINIILLNKKSQRFDAPILIGTTLNYEWTNSNKETLFVFIKPNCGTCQLYKDSINQLSDKYNNFIQFKGLYNPKNRDEKYFKSYHFSFTAINNEMRKSLHLALTPQVILVENNKVTFVSNFYTDFKNEFKRLKQYLEEKYAL